jgi:glycosyltransferase involved in cell wall biosynthesis
MSSEIKSVLIISPESWGKSKVSKHHYALAFANKGYKVYFLNLITNSSAKQDVICSENESVVLSYIKISSVVDKLRFHSRPLYNFIMKSIINKWTKKHPKIDHLISFDCNGVFTDLSLFKAKQTILFPVDQINDAYKKEYKGFDKLMSISPVILKGFSTELSPTLLHHGLSSHFTDKNYEYSKKSKANNITYVGNLLIGPILDKKNIIKIIKDNLSLTFHFYGAYEDKNNNLGSNSSDDTLAFIKFLKESDNCILHGVVSPRELSEAYKDTDAFFVCYDYKFDKNECSNSHKIMEYLSTGKPIISTRISMYDNMNLFSMLSTFDNSKFSKFFEGQIHNWETISNLNLFEKRKKFAEENSYANKIFEIIDIKH